MALTLYSYMEKKQLREMLDTFESCMGIPVQIMDPGGEVLETAGSAQAFCRKFDGYLPREDSCQGVHTAAAKKARDLKEPYIFSCNANLSHIVIPLISQDGFLGSVLAGPFLTDPPESGHMVDLDNRYHLPVSALLDLYREMEKIPVIGADRAEQVSRLLYYLFYMPVSHNRKQHKINQKKTHQQSRINESIQRYRISETSQPSRYPYEKEKDLITKVKTGNVSEAKGILNDLLGYVLFSEGNSLDTVKSRAIELCSLLSRAAIEGGAPTDNILKINNQFLKTMQQINSLDDLCFKLQETVEVFTDSMFNDVPVKNQEVVRRAINYISRNYASNLTLGDVAEHVHLNPAYFSTIFKQSCGSSFKEYLNMVRVEESKRLLANTDYSVIDIAIAVGFEDQSYFSKVFKKYTGLTPRQYQRQ